MNIKKYFSYFIITLVIVLTLVVASKAAITQISGLAVAESSTKWNNLKDAAAGDNLTNGIGVWSPYLYDGTNYDAARGDPTNGLDVDVTRVTGTVTVSQASSGTAFYAIKRVDISNAGSVNIAFGFTSKKIAIETDSANTTEICIDWIGGTAACPTANTAGDDRLGASRSIVLDDYAVTSISVIATSAVAQTIYIRSWN